MPIALRAAPARTPWWRWLHALTVPWELRRRRWRLRELQRLARWHRHLDNILARHPGTRSSSPRVIRRWISEIAEHIDAARRRPCIARGTRNVKTKG